MVADTWVAVDFETANEHRGSICSVGMVAIADGNVTERWSTLVQPPAVHREFSAFNTRVHGIGASDVQGAPMWADAFAELISRVDGRPVVAHNAAFDIGALRDACDADELARPELRYACSLVTARRAWPERLSYKLDYLVEDLQLDLTTDQHHTALWDAEMSARVMLAAMQAHGAVALDDVLSALNVSYGRVSPDGGWSGSVYKRPSSGGSKGPLPKANPDADPDGALYGRTVLVTGTLSSMTRVEALQRIADAGGCPDGKSITKATNILVVGELRPSEMHEGRPNSSKVRKAEQLRAAGQDIELLDEAEFLARLAS